MNYYTAVMILMLMTLFILCILVWENGRIRSENKRIYYLTYFLIGLSALAEKTGLQLSGNKDFPVWLLIIVKVADYILTPMAGAALWAQIGVKGRSNKIMFGVLLFNTIFQIISSFFGWIFYIDENGFYRHGPFYFIYIIVYVVVIILTFSRFINYGKSFRNQNQISLFAIVILINTGIIMQEALGSEYRTSYLALTFGAALMYIHFTEFSQIRADDYIQKQQIEITTDTLTGLFNRYAYSMELKKYSEPESVPEDLAVFLIDINELKKTNDTLGHEAGDELIIGAADCIYEVMKDYGKVYRIGGDEFVAICKMNKRRASDTLNRLNRITRTWKGEKVTKLRLAAGYALASEYRELNLEKLIQKADHNMYEAKASYYSINGIDRRNRQQ